MATRRPDSISALTPKRSLFSSWGVNVSIALVALRTNLMRSLLTMLGVMIGVFAVTMAVAVGNGAAEAVTSSVNNFGSNMAFVIPRPDDNQDFGPPRPRDGQRHIPPGENRRGAVSETSGTPLQTVAERSGAEAEVEAEAP